ncbi:MAG: serine/threonine-protein kinase, partial [Chloroflexota bacterium]
GQSEQFIERFRLEARTIARLQHPHILPLYDYGDENDILYLVMAYADGGSLSDRIRRGALPISEIQRLFEQIAGALDYAHRQNVIHRDIKPDNILIDREGHALLADFGIVKIMEDVGPATLTATGGLVGTPAYMSPEQAQGLPVDRRTDIYSLGIVLYEMLAGKQPFSAETPMQLVLKHMTAPVPLLGEFNASLPPALDAVMQHALQKDPAQRYASAREFYDDFTRVLRGEEPLTPVRINTPPPTTTKAMPQYAPSETLQLQPTMVAQAGTNPLVLLGGFAIIALLVVAVVALLLNFNRPTTPAPTATTTSVSVAALPSAIPASSVPSLGRLTYWTDQALGDTIQLQVTGLAQPPAGANYYVWLRNTNNDSVLKVGDLRLDPLGNGQLGFSSSAMLPVDYNAVIVTQAQGESDTPDGRVVYSGSVPAEVMGALREILITSPDGIPPAAASPTAAPSGGDPGYSDPAPASPTQNGSLLEGALREAQIAQQHAGLAADSTTVGSMHTHAEHTINIVRGTHDDYNGNGRGENPGLGYGIAYFTDRIQAKLEGIANAPSATRLIQSQVELIRVCIVNVRNWMNQVVNLESEQLTAEDLAAVHAQLVESTDLATALLEGVDLNQNGQIEPFEGECGLQQISEFGVSVGNIDLLAGGLADED